jgi:hypothetical protein
LLLRQPASNHRLRYSPLTIKLIAFGELAFIQFSKRSTHTGVNGRSPRLYDDWNLIVVLVTEPVEGHVEVNTLSEHQYWKSAFYNFHGDHRESGECKQNARDCSSLAARRCGRASLLAEVVAERLGAVALSCGRAGGLALAVAERRRAVAVGGSRASGAAVGIAERGLVLRRRCLIVASVSATM